MGHSGRTRRHRGYPPLRVIHQSRRFVEVLNVGVNAITGELLRDLVLDPTRDHQPQQREESPDPKKLVRIFPMS